MSILSSPSATRGCRLDAYPGHRITSLPKRTLQHPPKWPVLDPSTPVGANPLPSPQDTYTF